MDRRSGQRIWQHSETDIRATATVVQGRVQNRVIRDGNWQQTADVCSARNAKRNSRYERQAGQ